MGATNTTANYSLSQFIGTDKPAWLQDYNGDMLKIDTGINAAKVAADGAQNSASAAQNDANTANNAITNTINPAISALNTTVGNQGGSINTINSLIGNGTPTTTDQTIIGAINEINARANTHSFSAGVDLASLFTNSGSTYVVPEDGFVRVTSGVTDGDVINLKINDIILLRTKTIGSSQGITSVYVKKGSIISAGYLTAGSTSYEAVYYELT